MSIVALHLGAGNHSVKNQENYLKLSNTAVENALDLLKENVSSLRVCAEVLRFLENSPLTNAGYGSSLSINGEIECDAGIMNGSNRLFGAVGATSCLKNPILGAEYICHAQVNNGLLSGGRVAPMILCGNGVSNYLKETLNINGLTYHGDFDAFDLKSSQATNQYKSELKKLRNSEFSECQLPPAKMLKKENELVQNTGDTIGCLVVDSKGGVTSGASSGGIILKQPGRLGPSCTFGAGSWAEEVNNQRVATCTSGTGEAIIRSQLAQNSAKYFLDSNDESPDLGFSQFLTNQGFLNSPFMLTQAYAGVLAISGQWNNNIDYNFDIIWSHNTPSMVVGYGKLQKTSQKIVHTDFSTCSDISQFAVSGVSFNEKL